MGERIGFLVRSCFPVGFVTHFKEDLSSADDVVMRDIGFVIRLAVECDRPDIDIPVGIVVGLHCKHPAVFQL